MLPARSGSSTSDLSRLGCPSRCGSRSPRPSGAASAVSWLTCLTEIDRPRSLTSQTTAASSKGIMVGRLHPVPQEPQGRSKEGCLLSPQGGVDHADVRSRRAATRPYEPTRTTTRQPYCSAAMACYARVRGGHRGGDPWMACKGSGVQIPSAPPQVRGPPRARPPMNRPPRAANRQQSALQGRSGRPARQ